MGKFYIFLDIDGVFNDWDWLIAQIESGKISRINSTYNFKPESVCALNYLITNLSKKYEIDLVISSTWRYDMEKTKKILLKHNILLADKIHKTPRHFNPRYRGEEILEYLKDNNYNKDKDEFVIIDDEMFDFEKHFDKDKIIKTDIYHNSLSIKMVNNFLTKLQNKENEEEKSLLK